MGRVEIQLEHETHRHRNRLILLEELHLIGRSVEALLYGNYLLVLPAEHIGQLDQLPDVLESIHGPWSDPKCDSLLWCHQSLIYANNDLSGST